LRGVRGVFVLMVQTQKPPLSPSRGEFYIGFLNKFKKIFSNLSLIQQY